jgi:hypothetical protein
MAGKRQLGVGRLEEWKTGRMEEWKDGRVEENAWGQSLKGFYSGWFGDIPPVLGITN